MKHMADFGIKKNASGYYDETAYKAITHGANPGEIWTHKMSGDYMLVLANSGYACTTMKLVERQGDDSISVMAKVPMYTNPYMISYCMDGMLTSYAKTVRDDELRAVQKAVGKALGIRAVFTDEPDMEEQIEALEEELEDKREEAERLVCAMKDMKESWQALSERCLELEKELPYKTMYHELLDKLLAKVGAAL